MKGKILIFVPILVALILLTSLLGVVSAATEPISDDFNQDSLAPFWIHIEGVSGDPEPVMNGAQVEITVPAGASHDLFPPGGNKANRIMQPAPDSNFEVETKFTSGVSQTYQMQGILVEQDADDFLRFEFFGQGGRTFAYFAEVEDGDVKWQKRRNIQPGNTTPLYLKINRDGNDWIYNYSLDSTSWSQVFTATLTRTFTVSSIGVYAANHNSVEANSPQQTTVVDYFYNTANPGPFALTANSIGNGVVDKDPDQITYSASQFVKLTPVSDPGSTFVGWSGPNAGDLTDNGDGTWSIVMDDDKSVTATFIDQYSLAVTEVGSGSVSLNPPGGIYTDSTIVTLTPIPDSGWVFDSWSGSDAGDLTDNEDGTWSITMDSNKSVSAAFLEQFALAVTEVGSGSVSLNPPGGIYTDSTIVTLTPIPDSGWVFDGWSGSDAGDLTDNEDGTWSITMDSNKSVSAAFLEQFSLAVIEVGSGSVSLNPPGGIYTDSTVVTLSPMPDPGWTVDSWSGPDAGDLTDNEDGTWSITMDGDKSVTATFVELPPDQYTLTVNEVGNGNVMLDPQGGIYIKDTVVTLEPEPDPGWTFDSWSGPDAGDLTDNRDGTWSIAMDGYKVVTATYKQAFDRVFMPIIIVGS